MKTLPVLVIRECDQCPRSERVPGLGDKGAKDYRCRATPGAGVNKRKMKRIDPYAEPPEWCPLRKNLNQLTDLIEGA
jgi:hypothetical protein